MKNNYDHTDAFTARTKKTITDIRIKGKYHNIPFLLSYAVKNNKDTTEYVSYVNTCACRVGMLSRDIIPDCINVMYNGFHAVKLDTMERDAQNHKPEETKMPEAKKDTYAKRIYHKEDIFQEQILPSVQEIEKICGKLKIPYIMVFAVADDGTDTRYECFENPEFDVKLTKDILSEGRKVIHDGYVSSLGEIMEDGPEEYGVNTFSAEYISYDGKTEKKSQAMENGQDSEVGKTSGQQEGIPDCWRVYKKGENRIE